MPTTLSRVPLPLKLVFTAYMALHLPEYLLNYGRTNFLYFCDVALVLTFLGVWIESSLLISMCCVGILMVQMLWLIDFFAHLSGLHPTPLTDYMFDARLPLSLRLLSLFHGWLPILLVYLVWKLGYDRRAFWSWTVLAWALLLVCFFFMPPPMPHPALASVNINYVYGLSDAAPQHWMPPFAWLALLMVGLPPHSFRADALAAGTHRAEAEAVVGESKILGRPSVKFRVKLCDGRTIGFQMAEVAVACG